MLLLVVVGILISIGLTILLGVYVYRDAKKRNMDPLLWTLIILLVPSFIDLIIYLVVSRNNR